MPPPVCPPTGTPAITLVISVSTRVLSIATPPLPKKFGDHEKSSSSPNTPALIQPTAAPTFSCWLLLTAPRSVVPALPPKLTPAVGLTKPSARAGAADSSNPNVQTTATALTHLIGTLLLFRPLLDHRWTDRFRSIQR